MNTSTEADVEVATLDWLASFGWQVAHRPDITPDEQDRRKHFKIGTL